MEGCGGREGFLTYNMQTSADTAPPPLSSTSSGLCLSGLDPGPASTGLVFLTLSFPPCRCCRAHVSRCSSTTGAGQQAALLSPVVAQYGTAPSALHCVCGAQCESRSPGGRAATLTGQSGAAQHENTAVSHFTFILIGRSWVILVGGWRAGVGGGGWGGSVGGCEGLED